MSINTSMSAQNVKKKCTKSELPLVRTLSLLSEDLVCWGANIFSFLTLNHFVFPHLFERQMTIRKLTSWTVLHNHKHCILHRICVQLPQYCSSNLISLSEGKYISTSSSEPKWHTILAILLFLAILDSLCFMRHRSCFFWSWYICFETQTNSHSYLITGPEIYFLSFYLLWLWTVCSKHVVAADS
jgi:hypothetical protein